MFSMDNAIDRLSKSAKELEDSCSRYEETLKKTDKLNSALDRIIESQNECLRLIAEIKRKRGIV